MTFKQAKLLTFGLHQALHRLGWVIIWHARVTKATSPEEVAQGLATMRNHVDFLEDLEENCWDLEEGDA